MDQNWWNPNIPFKALVQRQGWKWKYGSELIESARLEYSIEGSCSNYGWNIYGSELMESKYSIQGSHVQCQRGERWGRDQRAAIMLCVSITTSFKYYISNINAFDYVFDYIPYLMIHALCFHHHL